MSHHSYDPPQPDPSCRRRKKNSRKVRRKAADLAAERCNRGTLRNGEAELYASTWPTNFTKGLPHDALGGVDPKAFELFFEGLTAKPCSKEAEMRVPIGPKDAKNSYRPKKYKEDPESVPDFCLRKCGTGDKPMVRAWESPRAGHTYELEGPDADAVAMPPAPCLGSEELSAEMAEVYALALLRDRHITQLQDGVPHAETEDCPNGLNLTVEEVLDTLNELVWFDGDEEIPGLRVQELRRRRARFSKGVNRLTRQSAFRGSAPGAKDGPFISQFLLIGSPIMPDPDPSKGAGPALEMADPSMSAYQVAAGTTRLYDVGKDACAGPRSGLISYGTLSIDQRSTAHKRCLDYMTHWQGWLDVQNGANLKDTNRWETDADGTLTTRFLSTPRDLATYVHFDALYQAYLNACLLMASYKVQPSAGFPSGMFHSTRDSFATFGIPHVLSLVTEVATRALKAVRRQKFQYHLRARPEAVGGVLTLAKSDQGLKEPAKTAADTNVAELAATQLLGWISRHNTQQNQESVEKERVFQRPNGDEGCVKAPYGDDNENVLLPMAFPEGSPMHATYGAGHATVAGACVTILKAFFELYEPPADRRCTEASHEACDPLSPDYVPVNYRQDAWWKTKLPITALAKALAAEGKHCFDELFVPSADGCELEPKGGSSDGVTILGELNKLAANISIARNMAGVHYYSDYYDSLRLGERVAAGILQEQMLTYPDTMSMRFESFDGDWIVFENRCGGSGLPDLTTWVALAQQRADGGFDPPTAADFKKESWDEWWCRSSDGLEDVCGDANPDEPCFGRCPGGSAEEDDED